MKLGTLMAFIAVLALSQLPSTANAFECPKHFAQAQAANDKTAKDMKGMKGKMSKSDHALVHALLDDAKMFLAGAIHNHTKPQGKYDHARAIAKARAAKGSAAAADILHMSYMK